MKHYYQRTTICALYNIFGYLIVYYTIRYETYIHSIINIFFVVLCFNVHFKFCNGYFEGVKLITGTNNTLYIYTVLIIIIISIT